MCIHIEQDHERKLACVQTYLGSVLRECVGVGGQREFSEDCEGFGGRQSKGPGGANRGFGGVGEELKRQDGGKGWRIEEVWWTGGRGVDSSEEK